MESDAYKLNCSIVEHVPMEQISEQVVALAKVNKKIKTNIKIKLFSFVVDFFFCFMGVGRVVARVKKKLVKKSRGYIKNK